MLYSSVPRSAPGRTQNSTQDQLGGSPGIDHKAEGERIVSTCLYCDFGKKEGRGRVHPPSIG